MGKLKILFKNDFFRGSVFFTFSSFLVSFLNYLFNFFSARLLGPHGYGEITALFSYLSLTAIPTFVISSFIVQKVASKNEDRYAYALKLEKLLWYKLSNYWFIFLSLFLFLPFIPRITNLSLGTSIFVIPLVIISFIAAIYGAIQQGLSLLVLYGFINIAAAVIKLFGPVMVFFKIDGVSTVVTMFFFSSLFLLTASILTLRNKFKITESDSLVFSTTRIRNLILNRQFLLILASTLALNLLNNFDIIFVKKYFSSLDSGIYSSWSLLAKVILYSVGPLISVSFIFFSGEKKNSSLILKLSLLMLVIIGIVSYLGYTFFSKLVVSLFFGERFLNVLPYLGKASIFGSLYTSLSFINNYYVAKRSTISLIVPIFIPFYLLLIYLTGKSLEEVMNLNIYFSLAVLSLHLLIYLKEELNSNSKSAQ